MFRTTIILIFATALLGCTYVERTNSKEKIKTGFDRGPHGCIGSADYSWCAYTNQCERPWELARENGFENTQQAFDKF